MQKKIKIGIIGLGTIGSGHYKRIKSVPEFEIVALADTCAAMMKDYAEPKYSTGLELIHKGGVEAVVIGTPHFDHVPLGVAALKKGLHVLVEKPVAVEVKEARKLVAAHQDKTRILAMMFNCRASPVNKKMREMVSSGELGEIQRVSMVVTHWFRPESYFKSAGWRATWAGEGGGALLNQAPHSLDLLQWIAGMPSRVTANVGFGKWHDIEVEDEVTALLEYPNGATGTFVTSTGEAPGVNRIEVAGDRGLLVCDNGILTFTRNEMGTKKYSATTAERFSKPPVWNVSIPVSEQGVDGHLAVIKNFRDAILKGAPLVATGEEGVASLELANAMLMSGFTGKSVSLPLNAAAYGRELAKRIKTSRYKV
jgi:predicted dehydrogenase